MIRRRRYRRQSRATRRQYHGLHPFEDRLPAKWLELLHEFMPRVRVSQSLSTRRPRRSAGDARGPGRGSHVRPRGRAGQVLTSRSTSRLRERPSKQTHLRLPDISPSTPIATRSLSLARDRVPTSIGTVISSRPEASSPTGQTSGSIPARRSYVDRILRGNKPDDLPVSRRPNSIGGQSEAAKALGLDRPATAARARRRGRRITAVLPCTLLRLLRSPHGTKRRKPRREFTSAFRGAAEVRGRTASAASEAYDPEPT